MKALLYDILASLESWGFTEIFNINWHNDGSHRVALMQAMIEARSKLGINAYCVLSEDDIARFQLTGNEEFLIVHKSPPVDVSPGEYLDIHAGSDETGLMAAYFPDQVDTILARTLEPTNLTDRDVAEWLNDARRVTPLGYFGDPASYNIAEATEFYEAWCKMITDSIQHKVKGGTAVGEFTKH
jgi:creatinine amidohydrolase